MEYLDIFPDGLDVTGFTHLTEVSHYNSNYYTYKDRLVYGLADDDFSTEYYLIRGSAQPVYLGYSDIRDEPETLSRQKEIGS